MPIPSGPNAHVDVPLSNLAISAFADGDDEFIGDQLFPVIQVAKQSDKYYTIEKSAFLRNEETLRAPKTKALRLEFTVNSDSYFADNHALAEENALEDLANADIAIGLRENSARLVATRLRRAQEIRIANLVTSASNLGSGVALSGGDRWSDFISSNPLADVRTAHAFLRQTTGLRGNVGLMDWDTWQIVRHHPDLLDLYKHTSGGQLNLDQLAATFTVDKILLGQGIIENMPEGSTSSSITNIWSNVFMLAHIEPAAGLKTRTLGLRFNWQPAGFPGAMQIERSVQAGAGSRKVEIVEAGHFQAEKVVAADLGYIITGTL